jgi:hypothetical protein
MRQSVLGLVTASICLITLTTTAQTQATYSFTVIADNAGPLNGISVPTMSNTGVVAFRATLDDGSEGIFNVTRRGLLMIAGSGVSPEFNIPAISGNGTIVFCAREADSGPGTAIYAWTGDQLRRVVELADGPYVNLSGLPSANENDEIAFWATISDGTYALATRTIDGGPISVIARTGSGVIPSDSAPSMNSSSAVAFGGAPEPAGGSGIFRYVRGVTSTIVDSSGPFHVFSSAPVINDSGDILFHGLLDAGGSGIFVASKNGLREVVGDAGAFVSIGGRTALNNRGEVVFQAEASSGYGLFNGPDPVENKIVQVGDVIDGFRIDGLEFFHGLNDRGQIVFVAFNQSGSQRVYRADPHH